MVEIPDEEVAAILGETVSFSPKSVSVRSFTRLPLAWPSRRFDTGRVLISLRGSNEEDSAAGKWEFPGGHIDGREMAVTAAQREWEEEVGLPLPRGMINSPLAWEASNGKYAGFVYPIPTEDSIGDLHDRDASMNPDGDAFEAVAWIDPKDFHNHNLRRELLKDVVRVRRALKELSLSAAAFQETQHPRGSAKADSKGVVNPGEFGAGNNKAAKPQSQPPTAATFKAGAQKLTHRSPIRTSRPRRSRHKVKRPSTPIARVALFMRSIISCATANPGSRKSSAWALPTKRPLSTSIMSSATRRPRRP